MTKRNISNILQTRNLEIAENYNDRLQTLSTPLLMSVTLAEY